MSGRYRLTPAADDDIAAVLAQTRAQVGTRQHDAYAALISSAVGLVAREPTRIGSKHRGDLEAGLRSFPLALAARRRGAASHVLFYRTARRADEGMEVLRLLHHSMDPRSHLQGALD